MRLRRSLRASALRLGLAVCVCLGLSACEERERPPPNVKLLSTDIHVSIAHQALVLPFIALEDYARGRQSFSLGRQGDAERADNAAGALMQASRNPQTPKPFDRLSVLIDTYEWDDGDMRQRQVCPMLSRQWARSACDNPWAAVRQALPDRIELVDLHRVHLEHPEPRIPRCAANGAPRQDFPTGQGEAALLCEAEIYGGQPGEHHVAAVRIDGDLGAVWTVSHQRQSGETAQAMAARQGEAIVAFVRHGLGPREDFSALHGTLCGLTAPMRQSVPESDCGRASAAGID